MSLGTAPAPQEGTFPGPNTYPNADTYPSSDIEYFRGAQANQDSLALGTP